MSESVNITLSPYSIPNKATKILRLKGKLHDKNDNNENFPNRQIENSHKMKINHKNKNFFPLSELSNHSNNSNSDNCKKLNSNQFIKIQPPKNVQTSAVARRNARERNRVKQVNNGFAILRQHIPEDVAEAYEAVGGRGASKKLSKVETLRMAVEYIRSLEKLLDLDMEQSENYSLNSFKSESHDDGDDRDELDDELDLIDNNNDIENCDSFSTTNTNSTLVVDGTPLGEEYYIQYQNIAFINDRQYIYIPNEQQNTVQFIKLESNDENLTPHIIVGADDLVPQTDINAGTNISYLNENNLYHDDPATVTATTSKQYILDATMNYNNLISPLHIITPASSISPNSYSGQSLSPVANNELITSTGITITTTSHTSTMLSADEPTTNIITTTAPPNNQHYDHHDLNDDESSNEYYDKIYTMTSDDDYSRHHSSRLLMQALPPIGSIKKELDYH